MKWIRGPWWDGCWILSGLPIGAALWFTSINGWVNFSFVSIYLLALFQMAHSISPYVMAWTHSGFRQVMLRNKPKFLGVPAAVMAVSIATGLISQRYFSEITFFDDVTDKFSINSLYDPDAIYSPAWWLISVYIIWNTYHFGKQNFGVLSIYRRLSEFRFPESQRRLDYFVGMGVPVVVLLQVYVLLPQRYHANVYFASVLLAISIIGVLFREAATTGLWNSPRVIFSLSQVIGLLLAGPWAFVVSSLNHWLVAIGLASHVSSRRSGHPQLIFVSAVMILGAIIFWLMFWRRSVFSWNLREMLQITTLWACVRTGTGTVHFLYDRWVWQLSRPEVQETIGKDLFSPANAIADSLDPKYLGFTSFSR